MLEVIEAGGLVTLQDMGRTGWRRFGVPASGPMDEFAHRGANLLIGNAPAAATLEIGAGDLMLRAGHDHVIAAGGAGYELTVNEWTFPLWGSYFVRSGWVIQLRKTAGGMWAYLAIAGGFEATPVLGSRSTYLRGRFGGVGGRPLSEGDVLRSVEAPRSMMETAGRALRTEAVPSYGAIPTIDVIPVSQEDNFAPGSVESLFASTFRVSGASDRMGYRLEGPLLACRGSAELISEGIAPGAIQVPPDGAPIVLMADSATAGGYPNIGCVVRADMPLLAQRRPGKDEVRFRPASVEEAQEKYRRMLQRLTTAIVEAE